jgi:glycosyltransferase involved in cell wall biosynthesis
MENRPPVPASAASLPGGTGGRLRLAILLSHPVQYFAPMFRELARRPDIDLTVIYCALGGARTHFDPEFGRDVQWDTPLLEGYRYKALDTWWPRKTRGPLAYFAPAILREIRRTQYDVMVVFGWAYLTCWLAFARARRESLPWMLYGDTNAIYECEKRGLMALVRKIALARLFRHTSAFLASGTLNRRFYDLHGVTASRFDVPFTVDNRFFCGAARAARQRRGELRTRLGIPHDAILILFSGKLIPRKRPGDILEVLARLQPELPRLGALFVGDGELRASLERSVADRGLNRTLLLGFANQSELPALYAAADMLIIPSWVDPKPLVTNEAMACGLPVVVSDRTGVWGPGDLVRDGENGFVYPAGDVAALAEAVRRLTTSPGLRARMGRRSLEIVREFTPARSAESIAEAARFVCGVTHRCPVDSRDSCEASRSHDAIALSCES